MQTDVQINFNMVYSLQNLELSGMKLSICLKCTVKKNPVGFMLKIMAAVAASAFTVIFCVRPLTIYRNHLARQGMIGQDT